MSNAEKEHPVEYASSTSSEAEAAYPDTAPIPSYKNASAANAKAAAADHPSASASATVTHPPTHSDPNPAAAKKVSAVHRTPGVPTAMQVQRGQSNGSQAAPTPVPADKNAPRRTSWTTRDTLTNSAASSVARRRASTAREPSRDAAAADDFDSGLAPQSSAHRRREASQASAQHFSVERRQSSVRQGSVRAQSVGGTPRIGGDAVAVPPFQLLSAGHPVPELPRELEEAITAYYMSQLRHLAVSDQERVVYAMVAPRDVKAVMTCLKQQEAAGSAAMPHAASAASTQATPARSRGNGAAAAAVPSSRRRVLQEFHDQVHAPQQQHLTPAEKAAMERFHQHFTVEACAAFLDDALEVCTARRTRCYQEQPKIAKDQGIVLPEDQLMPLYAQSVSSLLYNMTGWTQPEARRLSRLVVSIVHDWMPTVVARTPPAEEVPKPVPAAAPVSPAKRPPVPMAPRPNPPQSVAAA